MVVFCVSSYKIISHKPLFTIKGAAQSVCPPCMNSGAKFYNDILCVISRKRLWKCNTFIEGWLQCSHKNLIIYHATTKITATRKAKMKRNIAHGNSFDIIKTSFPNFQISNFDTLVLGLRNHSGYWHALLALLSVNICLLCSIYYSVIYVRMHSLL